MADWVRRIAWGLAGIFIADRAVKLLALERHRRRTMPTLQAWPRVSLIQPITRGAGDLARNLTARAQLAYPGTVQHLFVCDAADGEAQAACHALLAVYPELEGEVIAVASPSGVAPKIAKLQAALPHATGDVLCFMDDDVAPRPDVLTRLIPFLDLPRAGAAFGLPCYTSWDTVWESILSGFVNANMPLSFVALTYLIEPFRITGHIAAFDRAAFEASGGLNDLEGQIDDDFALARRLAAHGYRAIQTSVVYDIANALPDARTLHRQIVRWFVLPRQSMLPQLTARERAASVLASGPALVIPGMLATLAITTCKRSAWGALSATLGVFAAAYTLTERRYLGGRMPWRRWLIMPLVVVITPLHALAATVLARDRVVWRGQRLRVRRDGTFDVLS
jgi:cellulose synthase/poly-beta-1,6-N-acetylglucosamine synthase-like glycosyltransferase